MYKFGIVVGKFYPLHRGHVDLIQQAASKCEKLIVIVSHHEERDRKLYEKSNLFKYLSGNDKLKIVQKTFQVQKEIIIPILVDESDCPDYPNGWQEWSELVIKIISNNRRIPKDFLFHKTVFFTSELQDKEKYQKYFNCEDVIIFDEDRAVSNISGTEIRQDIIKYWDYLPRASKELLCPTIAIVGGESSGKTLLVNKLGNYFSTTTVWEYGRHYCELELGGDEGALQYSDYQNICNGHFQDLRFAKRNANRFVISDTDYVTTQAFCLTYEKREHPSVADKIKYDRFDLVILLDNSTKWVDDGMRMIGDEAKRRNFQDLLKNIYDRYGINYVEVTASDYNDRYQICKGIIDKYLNEHYDVEYLKAYVKLIERKIKNGERI